MDLDYIIKVLTLIYLISKIIQIWKS